MNTGNILANWILSNFEIIERNINVIATSPDPESFQYDLKFSYEFKTEENLVGIMVMMELKESEDKESAIIAELKTKTTFFVENLFKMVNEEKGMVRDFLYDILNHAISTSRGVLFLMLQEQNIKSFFPAISYDELQETLRKGMPREHI